MRTEETASFPTGEVSSVLMEERGRGETQGNRETSTAATQAKGGSRCGRSDGSGKDDKLCCGGWSARVQGDKGVRADAKAFGRNTQADGGVVTEMGSAEGRFWARARCPRSGREA